LGKNSCYLPDLVAERMRTEALTKGTPWSDEIERKVRYKKAIGITLRRAPKARAEGFMLLRELLRVKTLLDYNKHAPDMELAQKILLDEGMDRLQEYLSVFGTQKPEILPKLIIDSSEQAGLEQLIAAIPKARHAEPPDDPNDIDQKHFFGMDWLDSLRYLALGVRDEGDQPEPDDIYLQRKMAEYVNTGRYETNELVWIARHLEDELAESKSTGEGFSLARRSMAARVLTRVQ
jgi:hypothetical protein